MSPLAWPRSVLAIGLLAACSPRPRTTPSAAERALSPSVGRAPAGDPPPHVAPAVASGPLAPAMASSPLGAPVASSSADPDSRFPPPLPPSARGAPDLARLRERLRPLTSRRFDAADEERGCPANETLGQYLDLLVREGSPAGHHPRDLRRLSGSCIDFPPPGQLVQDDPPADADHWYCRIESFVSDPAGESPWRYELRLRVRRADGAIDAGHLSCPGMP